MEIGWMHNRRQRQVLTKHKNWAQPFECVGSHKVALQAKEMEEQN
uniref:Uncharacterized protein n=1 Tax=Saimiri boliviensis boliviensis TaxID=39432 RepID=A0A2K6T1M4_SAIBB